MRVKLYCCIVTLGLLMACQKQKEETYMNAAVVTGYDNRSCPCCGGFTMTLSGSTDAYILQNPDTVGVTLQSKFPINLNIDWTPVTGCGTQKPIHVTRFALK